MKNKGIRFEEKILRSLNNMTVPSHFIKSPTPVSVQESIGNKITKGYYKESALNDFVGSYNGNFILIEAKVADERLNYSRIKKHQINSLRETDASGGIALLVILFQKYNKVMVLEYKEMIMSYKKGTSIKVKDDSLTEIKNKSPVFLDFESYFNNIFKS